MDASREHEVWRPIPGLEGSYEVSSQGRVRSLTRRVLCKAGRRQRGGDFYRTFHGRVLAPVYSEPYFSVGLPDPSGTQRIHVLMLEAFVGPRPDGMVTRHLNGIHTDNRIENLAYGTVAENAQDSLMHGTNPRAALTHCKRGHEFTEDNIRWSHGRTHRECRACQRLRRPSPKPPKTHCKRGHEFTPDNIVWDKRWPGRTCKTCYVAARNRNNAKRPSRAANAPKSTRGATYGTAEPFRAEPVVGEQP